MDCFTLCQIETNINNNNKSIESCNSCKQNDSILCPIK